MIEFKEALEKVNKYKSHLRAVGGAELKDSWVFTLGGLNGETVYGPKPVRVMKADGEINEWDTIKDNKEFKEKFIREIEI